MNKRTYIIIAILTIILFIMVFVSVKPAVNKISEGNSNIMEFDETNFDNEEVDYSSKDDLNIDMTKWKYDETNDVYYRIGLVYCANPVDNKFESLGIYVPGKYFNGKKNNDGITYTVELNKDSSVGNYNAETAPIVMPIYSENFSSQKAPTTYKYDGLEDYLKAGFIYVYNGARGLNEDDETKSYGAPDEVTDFKAAIRYLRYNEKVLPGNENDIYTFGFSGGGTIANIIASTGDSELYTPYLEKIGALTKNKDDSTLSDAVKGVNSWCPIELDHADEAYEWGMGQYSVAGSRNKNKWTSELSSDLSNAYAKYINDLKLVNNNTELKLEETQDGIYTKGSYYDYQKSIIENSLNYFIQNATFPYTIKSSDNKKDGAQNNTNEVSVNISKDENVTFQNPEEYINWLNSTDDWVTYDKEKNTATIKSLSAFIRHNRLPNKDVTAFDSLQKESEENKLFGIDGNKSLHFDNSLLDILKNNSIKYEKLVNYNSKTLNEFTDDFETIDECNNNSETRQNMYNPMYFINEYYNGYGASTIANHWRIRSGINQTETSITPEVNEVLSLEKYFKNSSAKIGQKTDIDYSIVWGQGHVTAENKGNATSNFIDWVNQCESKDNK